MAIHNEEINQVTGGFKKTLDAGSERMIFDSLQKLQYQYPYKSTVRELASNCIDAIRERDVARRILEGKTSVEEHYVRLEGTQYKDSEFNPSYYDLKWLSEDPNVYITYEEGSALNRDRITIRDNGVGLWGDRLMGYFKLAYSTKRLSRFGLGKFGMGAKAALSTGVPSYTVITRYNGKEMWFTVYSYQVVPAIPKFAEDGSINKSFVLTKDDNGNEVLCYYYDTLEKNGLTIIIESKKHHKPSYIDAVRSQLLYFDNIVFKIVHDDGRVEQVPVKANILYEDDIMVLSDNDMYTKPHILINKVNYGNVDFRELELEDRLGNISIKMTGEEVSISPNRENVLWDDVTRNAIVKRFKEVQATGERLLQEELGETDFMKWIRNCIAMRYRISAGGLKTLVGRLAGIVDLTNHTPVYKPDPDFVLNNNLFAGMHVRLVTGKTKREGSLVRMMIDRRPATFSEILEDKYPIIIQQSDTVHGRDKYLLENLFQDGFITIWLNKAQDPLPEDASDEERSTWLARENARKNHAFDAAVEMKLSVFGKNVQDLSEREISERREKMASYVINRWDKLNKYICASEVVQFYEDFAVPETVKEEKEESDELSRQEEVATREARQSAEERRKLSGKTVLFTPRLIDSMAYKSVPYQLYEWHKLEVPVADIDTWANDEVYYASEEDAPLLVMAACITRPYQETYFKGNELERCLNFRDDRAVRLVKVAQNRAKYYRDFKPIKQFFGEIKNKVLTMSNALIKWNTGRYVMENISRLAFLTNFSAFDQEKAKTYQLLVKYCADNYRAIDHLTNDHQYKAVQKEEYTDMINHMDRVAEIQLFVRDHINDAEAIASRVKEILGIGAVSMVSDGAALDLNIYDMMQELLEYAEPIHVMLNELPVLRESNRSISAELETEIRTFIQMKQAGISIQNHQ